MSIDRMTLFGALLFVGCVGDPTYIVIEGRPKQLSFNSPEETIDLKIKVLDANGNALPDPPLAWFSSNPAVVEASPPGHVIARGDGSATITVFSHGIHKSIPITVAIYDAIELSATELTLEAGRAERVVARIVDRTGKELSGVVSWSSSDPDIATVDELGTIVGASEGTTLVTATAKHVRSSVFVTITATKRAS